MGTCTAEALLVVIRAKCLECSGNSRREVERCKVKSCPLYPYRSTKAAGVKNDRAGIPGKQVSLADILTM